MKQDTITDVGAHGPLVTIMVPVYNVEAYIATCIRSIVEQTYRNLEIILIDDGSTDSSGKILDDFESKDSRVRVIHKENGGVSSARNCGLGCANGDFIIFVDSDDWIDGQMVEKMVLAAKSHDVDIVTCGMRYVNMKGIAHEIPYIYHPVSKRLKTKMACLEIIKELAYGGGSLCCRLIGRSLTLNERFIEEMRVSEDQEWLFRITEKANSAIYISGSFYNIRVRSDSATTISNKSDIADIEAVNQKIIAWASENNMTNDEAILNTLFVRSRLQYSSAVRAFCDASELSRLRKKMTAAYRKSSGLHSAEIIKYYISLLPPGLYRSTRKGLKKIKQEGA